MLPPAPSQPFIKVRPPEHQLGASVYLSLKLGRQRHPFSLLQLIHLTQAALGSADPAVTKVDPSLTQQVGKRRLWARNWQAAKAGTVCQAEGTANNIQSGQSREMSQGRENRGGGEGADP